MYDVYDTTDEPEPEGVEFNEYVWKDGVKTRTYSGRIYDDDENIMIVSDDWKVPKGLLALSKAGLTRIDFMTNGAIFVNIRPGMIISGEEKDYEIIAMTYEFLINLGIVVEDCMFVQDGDNVVLQVPTEITRYEGENKRELAKYEYFRNDIIELSVPEGIDYERVMSLIWGEERMKGRMDEIMREVRYERAMREGKRVDFK